MRWTALALVLIGCGGEGSYQTGMIDLGTRFNAKEVCSCVFVTGRDEATCKEWTRVSPDVATFEVDRDAKVVRSSALFIWSAEARFVSDREGCELVGSAER
jgi:hypothetical protein